MKIQHTLIALVILALLGGALFYLQKNPVENPSDAIPKEDLFSFQADELEEFRIEMPGQPAVVTRRVSAAPPPAEGEAASDGSNGEAKWEFESPEGVAADSMLVQSFVDALPAMKYTPLEEFAPESLAPYGLDQPAKKLEFKAKGKEPVTLLIGKENPSGYAKYGMYAGQPGVFLLDSIDNSALDKTLFDLRDKRVLPIDLNQATEMELRHQQTIRMRKLENGNWDLEQPDVRTDHGTSNYFVTRLTGAQMKTVEAEEAGPLREYGLDRPVVRLTVTAPDGTHTLLVGSKKDDGYYAKNSVWPHVFTINQSTYDMLLDEIHEFRNRYLFDFLTTTARRVEIDGAGHRFRFDKNGENWEDSSGSEQKTDASKVDVFLNSVHALRIQQYTTDRPGSFGQYGLSQPWLTVKVTFGEDNQEETVLFGRRGDKFYAARQGEPSVYEMSPNEPEALEKLLKELAGEQVE